MNNLIDDSCFDIFPELESERLIFRAFDISDAPDIYMIRSNAEVMEYMDSDWHNSPTDSENFISENIESYKNKEKLFWAIIEKSSNQFIGDFSYWRINRKDSRAEIGYTLKPEFWGKAYMKEAMRELITYGFKKLKLHSIEANVNPKNENSKKVLKYLGFKKEAYFRENYFYNGVFLDSEIYCLLESDFDETLK